ncbi:MAG: exonuclease SbcCD subunit D [Gemmatimonadota bacterium]
MRIAHVADLHLGFRQYHRLTPRGHNQREVDVGLAFERAITGIIEARPDAVIVAGDLFHAVRPTNSAILLAFRQFSRLRAALPDAPVIVIAGNHDTPRSSDTVSIFGLLHELGLHVALDTPQRFVFPALDLSVLAVPHQALFEQPRPGLEPAGAERHQVMVLHGETPDLFSAFHDGAEPGGAHLSEADLGRGAWSYVALGHYHVQHKVQERVWYSGALEYVSPNPWGELHEERRQKLAGKGWLLVDLERGTVEPGGTLAGLGGPGCTRTRSVADRGRRRRSRGHRRRRRPAGGAECPEASGSRTRSFANSCVEGLRPAFPARPPPP